MDRVVREFPVLHVALPQEMGAAASSVLKSAACRSSVGSKLAKSVGKGCGEWDACGHLLPARAYALHLRALAQTRVH